MARRNGLEKETVYALKMLAMTFALGLYVYRINEILTDAKKVKEEFHSTDLD